MLCGIMFTRRRIDGNYPYIVKKRKVSKIGRFTIVRDVLQIDGVKYPFSYESMDDAVVVLPVIDNCVLLIRQYRHALDSWVWELPAGGLSGCNPFEAASKELTQESGYRSNALYELGEYYISEGTSTSKTYFFVAYCTEYIGQDLEPTEFIEVHKTSFSEVERMVSNNEIVTSGTVLAWELFKKKRGIIIEN